MSTTTSETALARNLDALGDRNRDLAEQLRRVAPDPDLTFAETPQGVPSGTWQGRSLCSRHRPLDEADRLVGSLDLVEHAVVVVQGFGLGYHVQQLARRLGRAGLIIVFEPDLALLRTVLERIDHAPWMRGALLLFVTSAEDRAALARKLEGAESILAQGIAFLEHPPSRDRLSALVPPFTALLSEHVTVAKTTLLTTLIRSVDTVRNFLLNLDHYVLDDGVADLRDAAAGFPAVVVSAGPSLQRNLHLLARPGVRERCVIIAVQTTLRPLLEAGIRPHFVTALDFHEISRRFYEQLEPYDLHDVTLVVDPKVHPVVLDAYPGPVRCGDSAFLNHLLGDLARDMGHLPSGATVAHLALYLARHLGCDPVAMIGQDLAFTDGLYYAPGVAIEDVWAPELNPFNTVEMMQWQRIVRHRVHLHERRDVNGRAIFTDAQMLTYLQQFERDFARDRDQGRTTVDATEGGLPKQHTVAQPLQEFLDAEATRSLPPLPPARRHPDPAGASTAAGGRVADIRRDIDRLRRISVRTADLVRRMLDEQDDPARMRRHFRRLDTFRAQVEERFDAFEILSHLNQLGIFRRMKADRRIHMARDLEPVARQRAQLERDLDNVTWIADAATEMIDQLQAAERLLAGERVSPRPCPLRFIDPEAPSAPDPDGPRVAALVPLDPHRGLLGTPRDLDAPFGTRRVLQATLERLGASRTLREIVLVAPAGFDVEPLLDRAAIGLPVTVEPCPGSPFGPERHAIAAARLFADSCWRAGIAGMSIYDEILCPHPMLAAMRARDLDAALLVGPDWPLVDVTGEHGCDAVVRRYLEHPNRHRLVFTQAPPGLCGCLVSAALMEEMAQDHRLRTIGSRLVYQPHVPQGDPIARDANVQIDPAVRRHPGRATFDTPRQRALLRELAESGDESLAGPAPEVVRRLEALRRARPRELPQHLVLELGSERVSRGLFARRRGTAERGPMTAERARGLLAELGAAGDAVLTLDGLGDPLLHPAFDEIIHAAKEAGVLAVHVRTELPGGHDVLDRLLACGADVVSVDLHADRAATYERMMGVDRFREVLLAIQHLVEHRTDVSDGPAGLAFALPWIVPRLQRCAETLEDINSFYDRWTHSIGAAVIEGLPAHADDDVDDPLLRTNVPEAVIAGERARTMTVLADGGIVLEPGDVAGRSVVGRIGDRPLRRTWADLLARRACTATRAGAPERAA